MRPRFLALAALGLLVPASASAKIIEVGATKTPLVAPTCPSTLTPSQCTIVLTEVTAIETIRDGIAYPTKVTHTGFISAFTLGLSRLDSNQSTARKDIRALEKSYGGTPQAAIAVLRQTGNKRLRRYKVMAESPAVQLRPYLGQVVQFPLSVALPVKRGDVIALSVPTWAPVLSINLPAKKFAYRQGRSSGCKTPSTKPLAQRPRQSARYECDYTGTRVEYSATEITSPSPPKNYVH